MDVRIFTPPTTQPSASPVPSGPGATHKAVARRVPPPETVKTDNKVQEQRQHTPVVRPSSLQPVRVELFVDDQTNQVFGRVVDRNTGKEIRQIPAEDVRRLQAISREMFGSILDQTV